MLRTIPNSALSTLLSIALEFDLLVFMYNKSNLFGWHAKQSFTLYFSTRDNNKPKGLWHFIIELWDDSN